MPATKEEMPKMIAELVNRQANVHTINLVQGFLGRVLVQGAEDVANLSRCFAWLSGVTQGEQARIDELKAQLPAENTEIKLGEAPAEAPAVAVSGIEISKGSPVLGG